MVLEDMHGNPIQLNRLYVDYRKISGNSPAPFLMNYAKGVCKVTELRNAPENLSLQITYEITGSGAGRIEGKAAQELGLRLIPLDKEEVKMLIADRKRRLSFLEDCEQSKPKYTNPLSKFRF